MIKLKFKKGDQVAVISGKSKGIQGKIMSVFREKNRAIVQGVNLVTKHTKPTNKTSGGIIKQEASIHISNLAHVDPKTGVPTRVGYKILEDGKKVRYAKKSGEIISEGK